MMASQRRRVPNWFVLALLVPIFGILVYRHWTSVPYLEHTARSEAHGLLDLMASKLRSADEAGVRGATPLSLLGADADRFGTTYEIALAGAPPHWAGTRLLATRNGNTLATLTILSLRDGISSSE